MREIFLKAIREELLGPRGGPNELMDSYPLREYMTGIIAPRDRADGPVYAETESSSADGQFDTEDEPPDDVGGYFDPAVKPTELPNSFGLSFNCRLVPFEKNVLRICLTWARYSSSESKDGTFRRKPRAVVLPIDLPPRSSSITIGPDGPAPRNEAELALELRFEERHTNCAVIALLAENIIGGCDESLEEHIFQPQIRIVFNEGIRLYRHREFLQSDGDPDGEAALYSLVYRDRYTPGKGYITSIVWKDTDPEDSADSDRDKTISDLSGGCSSWQDGELLSRSDLEEFTNPDIRTEFMPTYNMRSPGLEWRDEYGEKPELSLESLSEAYPRERLSKCIEPLIEGYSSWIEDQKRLLDTENLPVLMRTAGERAIDRCNEALERMKDGLAFITEDGDARLAFCFANKAIALQAAWKGEIEMSWRPFQLGFFLMTIESVGNRSSTSRRVCDILWMPTGGGKTEAYLFILAFALAYRRRTCLGGSEDTFGTYAITRYTLRLLTIQQFRRTLRLITACEYLRVFGIGKTATGWRPEKTGELGDFPWGSSQFSLGLWVGGGVSPNRLKVSGDYKGAVDILCDEGGMRGSEPAQVTQCPACGAILAVPKKGLDRGIHTLHYVVSCESNTDSLFGSVIDSIGDAGSDARESVESLELHETPVQGFGILSIRFRLETRAERHDLTRVVGRIVRLVSKNMSPLELQCSHPVRPGYFIRKYQYGSNLKDYDFDIYCPDPDCPLSTSDWVSCSPAGSCCDEIPKLTAPTVEPTTGLESPEGYRFDRVPAPFRKSSGILASRIRINALTVDEQVYSRLPTVVVATVDKFARPPFEPRAGGLFGNVEYHHPLHGFYREYVHPGNDENPHPSYCNEGQNVPLECRPRPPGLIIQDELHLLDGPLGSMMGIYETAFAYLCRNEGNTPKYIASSATIRETELQVGSLFNRSQTIFPAFGIQPDDRFFAFQGDTDSDGEEDPGRLYLGICCPGRGAHTPLVRIWSRLLQTAWEERDRDGVDYFWTLTGYFNAIRELAGARALFRQDIPQRIREIGPAQREFEPDREIELSSRVDSTELPGILDMLKRKHGDGGAADVLFTTSMFGTGIDIGRLSLMYVAGQPKSTSAYVQATGRVGRKHGGLVTVFFRATRPRDLDHFENFIRYHHRLLESVEPPSVFPFSGGVVDRSLVPLITFMLRNGYGMSPAWNEVGGPRRMSDIDDDDEDLQKILRIVEARNNAQKSDRRHLDIRKQLEKAIRRWRDIAEESSNLEWVEYSIPYHELSHDVVLGDAAHRYADLKTVADMVPQSLRDIEETTGFQDQD